MAKFKKTTMLSEQKEAMEDYIHFKTYKTMLYIAQESIFRDVKPVHVNVQKHRNMVGRIHIN